MKIGSMFSGYGGLDLAVEAVFNAKTIWHAEWEDAPSKILATHWPGVPNYRDVTQVDWATVPPVDIITGGFPCQDVSLAGRRAGMTEGTRSNLWGAMRTAIETIQPRYVVAENVRGLLSAKAYSASDMEPGQGPVGDDGPPNLRALGRVVSDLDELGYVGQWCGLRAADVGAPHGRFRVFILATRRDAADADDAGRGEQRRSESVPSEHATTEYAGSDATQNTSGGRGGGWGTVARAGEGRKPDAQAVGPDDRPRGPGPVQRRMEGQPAEGGGTPADPDSQRGNRSRECPIQDGWGQLANGGDVTADAERVKRERRGIPGVMGSAASSREADGQQRERIRQTTGNSGTGTRADWGPYAPAIHRWEEVLGRAAPAPTELTAKGKHRLSAEFVEFMMGLPAGWVTDIDISRNEQLKALGNGVVPAQAAAALDHMLNTQEMETAA